MKVYDKEIYKKQESISMTAILIIVFLVGFFVGYIASSTFNNTTTSNDTITVVESKV